MNALHITEGRTHNLTLISDLPISACYYWDL